MNEKDFRCGFATIIGRSNVGKSTLMNRIIGMKIAITSPRVQTTRKRIRTVYTCPEGQVVFVDTPGVHRARTKLGEYMDRAAIESLTDVDVCLWVVEPSVKISENDREIAKVLSDSGKKTIIVINKSDTVKKNELLPVTDAFSKLAPFEAIIPVSALTGEGIDDLTQEIIKNLPEGPALYDEETVTEETVRSLSAEIIREKALKNLKDEVPHGIAVDIISMKEERDITRIEAEIICEKESHKGIIIGKGGSMLKTIGSQSRGDIERMLEGHVALKLFVKVRNNWRDNERLMKSYGYDTGDL
ncbi:MAG: GTPase Era [Lachnospiraceae bacterium]|nr:GTPase Era [Lachnospiraceae bacterium]